MASLERVRRCVLRPTPDPSAAVVCGLGDGGSVLVDVTVAFNVDMSRPLRGFTLRVSDTAHADAGLVCAVGAAVAAHCSPKAPVYLAMPPDAAPPPVPGVAWEVVAGGGPYDEVTFKAVREATPSAGMMATWGGSA
jgi:hypothetical protein